jgi:hypothetical protein
LEILVSIGNVLTFNIRCESADDFSEVFGRFTEAALVAENSFSFDPLLICH